MVGGDIVTDAATFSYIVGIQPKYTQAGTTGDINAPFCSGVLIEGRTPGAAGAAPTPAYYVLTSAHCALSYVPRDTDSGLP